MLGAMEEIHKGTSHLTGENLILFTTYIIHTSTKEESDYDPKVYEFKVGLWIWIGLRTERLLEQVITFQNLAKSKFCKA